MFQDSLGQLAIHMQNLKCKKYKGNHQCVFECGIPFQFQRWEEIWHINNSNRMEGKALCDHRTNYNSITQNVFSQSSDRLDVMVPVSCFPLRQSYVLPNVSILIPHLPVFHKFWRKSLQRLSPDTLAKM